MDTVYPLWFQATKFRTVPPFLESVNVQTSTQNEPPSWRRAQFHKHRRKKYLSSRLCYYSNTVAGFQITRLVTSGDICVNPGIDHGGNIHSVCSVCSNGLLMFWLSLKQNTTIRSQLHSLPLTTIDLFVVIEQFMEVGSWYTGAQIFFSIVSSQLSSSPAWRFSWLN